MDDRDWLTTLDAVESLPGGAGVPSTLLDGCVARASAAFRAATGQWISYCEYDRVTLDPDGSWCLLLPELPVTMVHFVEVTPCSGAGRLWSPECCQFQWSAKGILRKCPHFPSEYRSVTVTYDHGYDPVPDDIQYAVAEAAIASASIRPGVDSVQLGAASYRFAKPGATQAWDDVVRRYKVRVQQ